MPRHNLLRQSSGPITLAQPDPRATLLLSEIHLPERSVMNYRNVLEDVQFGSLPSQNDGERHRRRLLDNIRFGSFPSQKERDLEQMGVQVPDLTATSEGESRSDGSADDSVVDNLRANDLMSARSKKFRTWPLDVFTGARAPSWTTCPSSLRTLSRESSQRGPCSVIDADGCLIGLKDNALNT